MSAHPAPKLTNSLNALRVKLDEPPASGSMAVASAYDQAVVTKRRPVSVNTTGVSPMAYAATTPKA